jgi:glucokinase
MLLAGDIGGTKTLLGIFRSADSRPDPVRVTVFPTAEYTSLDTMVERFLDEALTGALQAATFGVAGPIIGQVAQLTNVPCRVEAAAVGTRFSIPRVTLLNDLEAMAYAVPTLRPDEVAVLQPGDRAPTGNAALIAAGTGLGEALLHNVNGRFVPSPTEGGHADFAPRTPVEIGLLSALIRLYGRADYERVLSGPGLVNIHRFTHAHACPVCDPGATPAAISAAALDRRCPDCVRALEVFVSVYGAEAGNLALRSMASGGVFIGGGIAPKILPALQAGAFIEAFRAKGPMADFTANVPVAVILNERVGLLGAAVHAGLSAR